MADRGGADQDDGERVHRFHATLGFVGIAILVGAAAWVIWMGAGSPWVLTALLVFALLGLGWQAVRFNQWVNEARRVR